MRLGILLLLLSTAPAILAQTSQQGDLDTTFGTAGKVRTNLFGENEAAEGMAIQSDGKIVVAGTYVNLSGAFKHSFMAARYNSNGTLDTTFNGVGAAIHSISSVNDDCHDMALQPDGKIILVGGFENSADGFNGDFAMMRLNTNGSLDTTFNGTGRVMTSFGTSHDRAYAVTLAGDGKILVAGLAGFQNFALARYHPDGSLDTSFNSTGKVVTSFGGGSDQARCITLQSDGKIILAGRAGNGIGVIRLNENGTLDTSFNGTGKVSTNVGSGNPDEAHGVVVQPDGKVVVAGFARMSGSDDFAILRYNSNGSLDTSFGPGGAGIVTTPIGTSLHDRAYALVLQPDGKLVANGASGHDFAWARYNKDGSLDTTVQGTGKVITGGLGLNASGNAVAIQADGKIVLAGRASDASQDIGLARYHSALAPTVNTTAASNVTKIAATLNGNVNPNGNATAVNFEYGLTASYGSSIAAALGSVSGTDTVTVSASPSGLTPGTTYHYRLVGTSSMGTTNGDRMTFTTPSEQGDLDATFGTLGKMRSDLTGNHDVANSLVILGDGKLLVGGGLGFVGNSNGDFQLSRFNSNGTLDTTFNTTGYVTASLSAASEEGRAMVVQPDGKILLVGNADTGSSSDFALVRFNANGSLDTSFNSTGMVTTDIGTNSGDIAYSVALQTDGKIIVAGTTNPGGNNTNFALARYNTNGSLDTSFNTTGKVITDFAGSHDEARAVVIQADGKIIVGGAGNPASGGFAEFFALARYNTNGSLDTSFNGTGKVTTNIGTRGEQGKAMALQPDGKIILAGYTDGGPSTGNDFAVVRYTTAGALDTSFNGSGMVVTAITNTADEARAVMVQADGKIIVAGGADGDFALARYLSDGSLDSTILGTGSVRTNINSPYEGANAVAQQADGKIVLAGATGALTGDIGLVRYLALVAPSVITQQASNLSTVTTTLNGRVNPNGNATTVTFEYGLMTSYGSSISATLAPVSGSSALAVSATLNGLTPGATYHYRIVGASSGGTASGDNMTFTTASTLHVPRNLLTTLPSPATGAQTNAQFGTSVAVDGIYTVVGSPLDDAGATDCGVVKVYHTNTGALLHTIANPSPATGDSFGFSVRISGTRVVVGAYADDTGTTDAGSAYVYDLSGSTPTIPMVTLNNPGPGGLDYFGQSVAISGMRVIVGAHNDDTGASNAGSAYVYDLSSITPTVPEVTLNNPGAAVNDFFGISVAISGARVVVGAYGDDTGAADAGSAYVYDLSSGTPAAPVTTLNNPAPVASDSFGNAVSISGTRLVVGARQDDALATDSGSVYAYDLTSGTPAVPNLTLNNPGTEASDYFGTSVALSGTTLVVGSLYDNTGAGDAGSAYVFDLVSGTPTVPIHTLNNPAPLASDEFGSSGAIAGTKIVIGSLRDDAGATDAGSAYIYDITSGTPTVPTVTLNSPGPSTDDRFGIATAISGTRTAVGMPREDTGASNAGSVFVYDSTSGTPTVPVFTLSNPGPAADDNFGNAVAIQGSRVLVGTPFDDTTAANSGAAYFYDLSSGTPTVPVYTFINPVPGANDNFGNSVALEGTLLVIGAAEDDTSGADTGSAYVYDLASATPTVPVYVINNPSPASGDDSFGSAVGISGRRIVIAALSDDPGGVVNAGSVYAYDLNTGTPTVPVAEIFNPLPASGDFFGWHAAISGTRIVVGALSDDTLASDAGAAYVYDLTSGTPTVPAYTLPNPTPVVGDNFGHSVSIAGNWVAVGASNDGTAATGSGSVYYFDLASASPTIPVQTLPNPSPSANDDYGLMMAMDGQRFIVGAPFDDMVAVDKGAAYLYGPSSTPEIDVAVIDGAVLADASSVVYFGYSADGLGVQKTFRITNLGGVPLTGLALTKSGAHASDFALGTLGSTSLAPGASTVFTVTFSASAVAARQAVLHIASNDADESPFDVTMTGSRLAGSVDPSYNVDVVGGSVEDSIELPSGKIMIGGWFSSINGVAREGLARLNGDGTLDTSFAPVFSGTVYAFALLPNGKLLIGGSFTITSGGSSRSNLARLNADGSLDTTLPAISTNSYIQCLAAQADEKMVIGGWFTTVGGQSRNYIARINTDGSLDLGYDPNASLNVETMVLQSDGRIVIGGQFSTVSGITRNRIARINTDGSLDSGFNPNASSSVEKLAIQPDGKILMGGNFLTVGGVTRNRLARLNTDGSLDSGFFPNLNSRVDAISIQSDGKILAGGFFTTVAGGLARQSLARFNSNGSVDSTFRADCDDTVQDVMVMSDGRIVVGGGFSRVAGQFSPLVAILSSSGTVLSAGTTDLRGGSIMTQSLTAGGKLVIGGSFSSVNELPLTPIARLLPSGIVDPAFTPPMSTSGYTYSTIPQADGRLIYQDNNTVRRLNADGSLDSTFSSFSTTSPLNVLTPQADGKILVGGSFTTLWGQTRNKLARVNADGTLDTGFNPNLGSASADVWALAVQPDGKILVGGTFTTVGGVTRNRIARLNVDGSLDTGFDPGANSTIYAIQVQPDGKILVGGAFTTIAGSSRSRLARLNSNGSLDGFAPQPSGSVYALSLQADGKIWVGGSFTVSIGGGSRNRLARLNADGSLDTGILADLNDDVYSLTQTDEGQVLVGGAFSQANGVARTGHVRLTNTTAMQSLTANSAGTSVTWVRAGTSPEVDRVTFESSLDGSTWTSLGNGTRTTNGWQLTGLTLPSGQSYQVRAQGIQMTGGFYGGDSSIYETTAIIPASGGAQPEIVVQQAGMTLTDEVSTMDFGNLELDTALERLFVVLNTGTSDLSGIAVTLDGPHAADYRVRVEPATALAAGGNTSFILRFQPTAPGPRLARLRIYSNDADENPFDIALSGHAQLGFVGGGIANVVGGFASTLVKQPDGKIWVLGNFDQIGGAVRTDIARLNADGSFDPSIQFQDFTGSVGALLVQADGKFLYGGNFGSSNGSNLRRLNANGTPDTSFVPSAGSTVNALAQQADGKLLIGGSFTSLGGQTRNRIGRLNLDGTLDLSFNPNANGTVQTIVVQPDGKILVGGSFTTIGGVTRNRIARLSEDGTLDTGYDPNANGTVNMIQRRTDGSIYVSGSFSTIGGQTRGRMAIVNGDGSVTSGFNPNANSSISAFQVLGDGRILVCGSFTTIEGVTSNRLARLNNDGTQDYSFTPVVNDSVTGVVEVSDGKIMISGSFTQVNYATRNRVARLNSDGSLDMDHDLDVNGAAIMATVQQLDGATLVGGWFTHVNNTDRSMLARVSTTGILDTVFNPNSNGEIYSLALQPDGMILTGGAFTSMGGSTRSYIARLHANGVLDSTFNPNANNHVYAVIIEPSGSILLGGAFTTIGGTARNRLARITSAGVLDATFNPNLNSFVSALALQPDGKILIGGGFTTVDGTTRNRLARLNADGTVDTGFNPNINNAVWGVQIEADGKILVNGEFTTVGGIARPGLARLNADGSLDVSYQTGANDDVLAVSRQVNGSAVIGGRFTSLSRAGITYPRNRMALLNAHGQVDFGFVPSPDFSTYSLTGSADGRTLMGGLHVKLQGTSPRPKLVRLNHGPAMQALTAAAGGSVVTWARSGTSPEVDRVTFETSPDGSSWVGLGSGTRTAAGWQLTGLSLPTSHSFVRARGYQMTGGYFGGDGSVYELVQAIAPAGANAPEIVMEQPLNTNLVSGSTTYDFGSVLVVGSSTLTYHVRNTGNAPLTGLAVTFGGANAADFSVTTPPQSPLQAGGTTSFVVQFAPKVGARSATMQLWSNDADESPFTIDLTGLGVAASASVTTLPATQVQSRTALLNGSVTDNGATVTPSFEYGLTTSYGSDVAATPGSVSGHSSSAVSATITGLEPSTTYHYRVLASGFAIAGGQDATFTTAAAFTPGEVDHTYPASSDFSVLASAEQPDGKMVLGGFFTSMNATARIRLARLNADGALDSAFNPGTTGGVWGAVVQEDGKIVVAGDFASVGGQTRGRIARLNADGSVDPSLNLDANGLIFGLALQPDGKILIGGQFTTISGTTRNGIARINADGTLDSTFNPNVSSTVICIAVQPDGKILIGGPFSQVGGVARQRLARLNADGSLDTSFVCSANSNPYSIALQPDGKIIVGGQFTTLGGITRNYIGRLEPTGAVDASFNPDADNWVMALSLQANGKLLLGGYFTTVSGVARRSLARLNVDGTVDADFFADADDSIDGMTLLEDGSVFVTGQFSNVQGYARSKIARLLNEPATQTLSATSPTRVEWLRGGSSPETQSVTFEHSEDGGATWLPLGTGSRITGGWELTGASLGVSGQLRARARIVGGYLSASSGLIETTAPYGAPPAPEIRVFDGAMAVSERLSGTTLDLGRVSLGGTTSRTFIIINNGLAELTGINVTLSGAGAYSLTAPAASTLAAGASTSFNVTFAPTTAAAPQTATLHIASNDSDENPFDINLTGTGFTGTMGDNFANRLNLGNAATVAVSGSNRNATLEAGEKTFDNIVGATVWSRWTAPTTGWVTLHTAGSRLDTVISLYQDAGGGSLAALLPIGFNDESGETDLNAFGRDYAVSRLTFLAQAGTTYAVSVGGWNENGDLERGTFTLFIEPVAAPQRRVTEVSFIPTPADVTASAQSGTMRVKVEIDDPAVTSLDLNTYVSRPNAVKYELGQYIGFFDSDRVSGTVSSGTYEHSVDFPRYAAPGNWPVTVWMPGISGIYDTKWTTPGDNNEEDTYLIPTAVPAPVTVVNTGTVDSTGPTLVSVSGFPPVVDVTTGNVTFDVDITFTDSISGLKSVSIWSNSESFDGSISSTGLGSIISGDANSGVYRVPVTVYQGFTSGIYFPQISLTDQALNNKTYSDYGSVSASTSRISPPGSDLTVQIIGDEPEIAVQAPGGAPLTDGGPAVALGAVNVASTAAVYDFSGALLSSEFDITRRIGSSTVRQSDGKLEFSTTATPSTATVVLTHQRFKPRFDQSWSVETTAKIPSTQTVASSGGAFIDNGLLISFTTPAGDTYYLASVLSMEPTRRFLAHHGLIDDEGNGYEVGAKDGPATAAESGLVRIRYDAATKILTAEGGGQSLITLNLNTAGWGMTAADTFDIGLGIDIQSAAITGEPISQDDFKAALIHPQTASTFTVSNTGNGELFGLRVTKSGTNAADFIISDVLASGSSPYGDSSDTVHLSTGQSTTFTVSVAPHAVGPLSATIHISSNDADENPFDIPITSSGNTRAPTALTLDARSIILTSATVRGLVNGHGATGTSVVFDYGTTTGYGSNVAATPGSLTGGADTIASASLTGLTPGTTYHYRVRCGGSLGSTSGQDRTFTTPLSLPGELDPAFNVDVNNEVVASAVQPDGKIVIAGGFTLVGGQVRSGIARINSNGTVDLGFAPTVSGGDVNTVAVQEDGKILLGGYFTSVNGQTRNRVARLNANGSLDTGFNPNVSTGYVAAILPAPDGRIYIGGAFSQVGGQTRVNLARLHADGSLGIFDTTSQGLTLSAAVSCMTLQPDGKLLIGGSFTSAGSSNRVARINDDASLDTSFTADVNGSVNALALQLDGKVIVGGSFSEVGGLSRSMLARLQTNGAPDTTYVPNLVQTTGGPGRVESAVLQTDGKLIVAGQFNEIDGLPWGTVARLLADGTLDSDFGRAISINAPSCVLLGADGAVLVGGGFGTVGMGQLKNGPATNSLTLTGSSRAQWLRAGTSPEALAVSFEISTNGGTSWTSLGLGTRISGGWEKTGLILPMSGILRARARTQGAQSSASSGLVEAVYNYSGLPIADIAVFNGASTAPANERVDNTTFDFGARIVGSSLTATFTIRNAGSLNLTGISASLAGTGNFSFTAPGASTLAGGGTTTFTVTFAPTSSGAQSQTLLITSDDPDENPFEIVLTGEGQIPPSITAQPASALAGLGQPLNLSVSASGTSLQYEWRRNGILVPSSNAASFSIPAATLGYVGEWQVRVFNGLGSVLSHIVHVGVVDLSSRSLSIEAGQTLVLQVAAGAPQATYRWLRGGVAIPRGINPETLLVLPGIAADQAGLYSLQVSMVNPQNPGTPMRLTSGNVSVIVNPSSPGSSIPALQKPVLRTFAPGPWVTGGEVREILSAQPSPKSFTIKGLPPGVKLDSRTGQISGRPTIILQTPKRYALTITATNAAGTSAPQHTIVVVQPLPGYTVGTFHGLIERHETANAGHGGRITLTVTPLGALTGKLTLGAASHSFSGKIDPVEVGQDVTATIRLPRSQELTFTLNRLTGELSGEIGGAEVHAWHQASEAGDLTGKHTLRLTPELSSDVSIPQTSGSLLLTLTKSAGATWAGRLGDGTAVTGSSGLTLRDSVPLTQFQPTKKSSIQGWLEFTREPTTLSGQLDWLSRSLTSPFPLHELKAATSD